MEYPFPLFYFVVTTFMTRDHACGVLDNRTTVWHDCLQLLSTYFLRTMPRYGRKRGPLSGL